jgi:uncharacterized delta-60 repeat protein
MRRKLRGLVVIFPFTLTACETLPSDPSEPELTHILRAWQFSHFEVGALSETPGEHRSQLGGVVSDAREYGPLVLPPPGVGPNARSEVFSDATGHTYWASTQAPSADLTDPASPMGSSATLHQSQWFRKEREDATLSYTVTGVFLEGIDGNGGLPTAQECPWLKPGMDVFDKCLRIMWPYVTFSLDAHSYYATPGRFCSFQRLGASQCFFTTGGHAELSGWRGAWRPDVYSIHNAMERLWNIDDFEFDRDVDGTGFGRAHLKLRAPIVIEIPLERVPVGRPFEVHAMVYLSAINSRQRESYLSAYFRDPAAGDGLGYTLDGVTPIEGPVSPPRDETAEHPPVCESGTDPAGAIQFADEAFEVPERWSPGHVVVTRTGGGAGAASALLTTSDGSALAGSDYTAVSTYVLFANGETGSRMVPIPLLPDTVVEADETVGLTLSGEGGCATLGSPSSATLTILDDDAPPPAEDSYTIGGTLAGMVGSGLTLTNNSTDELMPANGPFVFDREYRDGFSYNVRIQTQPTNPLQACTLANGSGTVDGADVTLIEVTCAPPAPTGGLDPGFGDGGKVTADLAGGARALALPGDGTIIVAGDRELLSFLADGTSNTVFGISGTAAVNFFGSFDFMRTVAVQPDGKIVVAGYTRENATREHDFAIARFNADGTLDAGFGEAGQIIRDVQGRGDEIDAVLIQPDGGILVTGVVARMPPNGILDADFAIARYTSAGAPDPTFAGGGVVITPVFGRADLAQAAVLQPDGRIIVAGRVADSGGDDPDIALVRYNPDGTLDTGFGLDGIARHETSDVWDEVTDLAVQPDGKIVAAGHYLGGPARFLVARFNPDGTFDPTFGTGGVASPTFSASGDFAQAVVLQTDGKVIVGGQASNQLAPDFAIARLHPDGRLDTDFGTDGKVTIDFFGAADAVIDLVITPDGAILAAGLAVNGTRAGLGLARVSP